MTNRAPALTKRCAVRRRIQPISSSVAYRSRRKTTSPLFRRPVSLPMPSSGPSPRAARWGRLDGSNGPSAQEERLDDLRTRPAQRATASEALLAERIFTRESQHQPRRRAVDGRRHRLEPSNFLRHPTPTARLRIPGRERAAIGLVHGITGEFAHIAEQGPVPAEKQWGGSNRDGIRRGMASFVVASVISSSHRSSVPVPQGGLPRWTPIYGNQSRGTAD